MTADHTVRDRVFLLPLLLLYTAVVLVAHPSSFEGDEGRYVQFAQNLAHGFYVSPGALHFPSGPGYSLLLTPFALLGASWTLARILNAVLLFLGILYLHAALQSYLSRQWAYRIAAVIGLYPPFLRTLPNLLTETLAVFLMCGVVYHFIALSRSGSMLRSWHLWASGAYLGYLALTKVFFGYMILIALLIATAAALVRKHSVVRAASLTCTLALLMCTPYLAYTHRLTGKVFYWSTIGGASLYWMASPYPGDMGDWQGNSLEQIDQKDHSGVTTDLVHNHGALFASLRTLNEPRGDDALKRQALRNMLGHPGKFALNWVANIGRLLFSYPHSYTPQKLATYFYLLPNMLVLGLGLVCVYAFAHTRKRMPDEILALVAFGLISFIGSSLLSAYARHFTPLFPLFGLGIAVGLGRMVQLEILR